MKNVAVIGSGNRGKNLIQNFETLGALHTICDNNFATLRALKDKYPDKKFQTSYEAVLQNPAINAVVIASSPQTHFEIAKEALNTGKHVFVERPLALMVKEAENLQQLAKSKNLTLMVGHILQYHPAVIKLKEIIDSGDLGKINYIYSNRLNLDKIQAEKNILSSFAPHDISAIIGLLEEMPYQVTAQGGSYLNPDIADITVSILSFKSGVKGHIFVSRLHPYKVQNLVVIGDKKMAVFDDTIEKGKLQIFNKEKGLKLRQQTPEKSKKTIVPIESYDPLNAECKHFLECVIFNKAPKTDSKNGIEVLRVLDALNESYKHNGAMIKLDEKDRAKSFFSHKTALVDDSCSIGKDTRIWHFSHVMTKVRIGKKCNIGQNVMVSQGVKIGNNVEIQNNVSVCEGVVLEDDVFCGHSMVFADMDFTRSRIAKKNKPKKTLVKNGASIGANATILCGVTIGRYALIGAGTVANKDVPDYALVTGNPGEISGWMCECGVEMEFDAGFASCGNCSKEYRQSINGVERFHDEHIHRLAAGDK